MKFKHLLLSSAVLMGMTIFTTPNASASSVETQESSILNQESSDAIKDDFYSNVKVFDENGDLIPYTKEEIQQMVQLSPNNSTNVVETNNLITPYSKYTTFDYGPMTAEYGFYVGKGANGVAFLNPADTLITVKGTASKMTVRAYNDTGTGSGTQAGEMELPGGWSGTVHVSSWSTLPRNKSYRFYIEINGKKMTVDNVQVWYNWQG